LIYAVQKENRLIYEAQPIGEYVMIRPAQKGLEHLLDRISYVSFAKNFESFLARFLIPDQLDEEDRNDLPY
jgi:hypothetical protein